jgi:hypothetical protein
MSIKQFDRPTVRALEQEIIEALAPLAEKHGLTVDSAGGSFDDHKFSARVCFKPVENDEEREAREKREFAKYANLFGLTADHYGKQFTNQGRKYRLVGIEPQRPKFPFVAERDDGVRFKFKEGVARKVKPDLADAL